jgi:hypothetical protein
VFGLEDTRYSSDAVTYSGIERHSLWLYAHKEPDDTVEKERVASEAASEKECCDIGRTTCRLKIQREQKEKGPTIYKRLVCHNLPEARGLYQIYTISPAHVHM